MGLHERRVAVARRRFPNRRSELDRRIADRRAQSAPVDHEWRYSADPRSTERRMPGDRRNWVERRAAASSARLPSALTR